MEPCTFTRIEAIEIEEERYASLVHKIFKMTDTTGENMVGFLDDEDVIRIIKESPQLEQMKVRVS